MARFILQFLVGLPFNATHPNDLGRCIDSRATVAVAIWAHSGLYLHHKPLRAAGDTRE
jgi:hypothetical protein